MCIKCNNLRVAETFTVKHRGYNSIFDLDEIKIDLCDDCINNLGVKKEWFNEKENEFGEFIYEAEINNLLSNFNKSQLNNIIKNIV